MNTKYIYLTEQDTHKAEYAALSPIRMLHNAKVAYVQQLAAKKAAVYLLNEDTHELQALWVGMGSMYNDNHYTVYLLPHQKRARGKSDPIYYFDTTYWQHDELIDWLKSFDLQVFYAAGLGTSYRKA